MSQGNHRNGRDESFKAAADLSANQFCAVKISAANTVALATSSADENIGILQDKPDTAGRAARVATDGVTKAMLSGTVAIGQELTPDAGGVLIAASVDGEYTLGRSRVAHTADGASFVGEIDIVRGQFSTV